MVAVRDLTDKRTSGTRMGQATSDKIAFFGATPIVQPSALTITSLTTMTATTTALAAAVVEIRQAIRDFNTRFGATSGLGLVA